MPESIAAKALGFAGLQALAAVVVTFLLVGKRHKLPVADKLVVLWLVYVAIVHSTLVTDASTQTACVIIDITGSHVCVSFSDGDRQRIIWTFCGDLYGMQPLAATTLRYALLPAHHLTCACAHTHTHMRKPGQEYARADFRWGVSDSTIVTMEMWTVLFNGPMCAVVTYAILTDKPYR